MASAGSDEIFLELRTGDTKIVKVKRSVIGQHPEEASIVFAGLGAVSRGGSADPSQRGTGEILISHDIGRYLGSVAA